jgi:hypothetical protein
MPLSSWCCCKQHERFEHRAGLAPEKTLIACLEQLVADVEARVDRLGSARTGREYQRAQVLQHDRVELADFDRHAMEPLHQVLARPAVRGVAHPHPGGQALSARRITAALRDGARDNAAGCGGSAGNFSFFCSSSRFA